MAFLVSRLAAAWFKEHGFPSLLTELSLGFFIGNFLIESDRLAGIGAVAELGFLVLFFTVGFETKLRDIAGFGKSLSALVLTGLIVPAVLFLALKNQFGLSTTSLLFVFATLVTTGTGVAMRALQEFNYLKTPSSCLLIGASLIEDVPAILLLGFATSFAAHGKWTTEFTLVSLAHIVVIAALAWGLVRVEAIGYRFHVPRFAVVPILILAAWVSHRTGLTSLLGAFFIGQLFRNERDHEFRADLRIIEEFFLPVFFFTVGMRVTKESLMRPESWGLACLLIVIAFAGRLVCRWAIGKKAKEFGADPWLVTFGLVPRGLPGLVFSSIALASGFIDDNTYSALILMVTVTTMTGLALMGRRIKFLKEKERII